MTPRRRWCFRAIAVLGGGALAAMLLEAPVLLGDLDYGPLLRSEPPTTWMQLAWEVNRPDPELLHLHWPDSRFQGEVAGNLVARLNIPDPGLYTVDVSYDHDGFRNATRLTSAEVIAIGDSFVEGVLVGWDETVGQRIAARLGTTVANLGQSAYGFRQEITVLRRFGLRLRPRRVLWFLFGGNDLRDVESYQRRRESFAARDEPRPLLQRSFTRNALRLLKQTVRDLAVPDETAIQHSGLFREAGGETRPVYFGQPTLSWNDLQWEVATDTLREAQALVTQQGARLLVVYIPRKFTVYADLVKLAPGSEAASWKVHDLAGAIGQFCSEAAIPFVDTTPALRAAVARGESTYLADDVHWNAHGHEVAATAVVEALAQLDLERD